MSTYPVLNNRPIDQWKVTELKDELRRRELPIKGLKDDLVKRLFEALQGEILDGGEETVGATPPDDDLKEDETPDSADASVYQASMEQNVEEGPSEGATQEGDIVVSVTEASKESAVATTDISQEGAVATAEVSQKTVVVPEVSETPQFDVAATDGISLSDAAATKGDDLESVPSDSTIMKGVYPHTEDHSDIIPEKAPEDDTIKKMNVDDVPSDVVSTDVKLDATSAKSKFGVGVDCEILGQKTVTSPPDAITLHADPWGADTVATAPEQKAEGLIPKNNFGDNALMCGKDNEDCKRTNGHCKPILSGPKDEVSEVNPDLGSQIKFVSISHDNISTNEKNNVKGNLNADNSDLELEAKQEMVKPSSSSPFIGDDLQALDVEKELPKNETSLQDIDSMTNMNLVKKEESPDGGSPGKLNLDRSSGDESMEEDVMESKLVVDSNIKSGDLGGKAEVTSDHVVKEVTLLDTVAEGLFVHTKQVVAEEKPATLTEKRKPDAQEVAANNGPIKRQRRWNADSVKISEQQASKLSGSDVPKHAFWPAQKRSFGRSNSTASGDSPKERIVPPPQKPATTSLRIDRFVRPFTLKAVQELLGKTGSVCSFWMDHIKTHCYVTYSSVEEAVATRNAVYDLQWPPNNGNYLVAEFVDPQEVKLKLELPPLPALISPSTATTPKAPFQQPKANQAVSPHADGTSRGLLPTPQPLTKPPPTSESDLGPAREKLLPTPKNPEPSVGTLDDIFKKTQAYPRIYYMPLSEEKVSARQAHGKGKRGG